MCAQYVILICCELLCYLAGYQRAGDNLKCVHGSRDISSMQKVNNGTVINCCIVILHKGAITEVILVYELNAREFYSGVPISLEYFAWGCHKPGKPNSL